MPPSAGAHERAWFTPPAPIARLFAAFPLRTLPANPLPARTLPPAARRRHQLYVYADATEAARDPAVPSFNPACLQWQAYLRFRGVAFDLVPADNHAAPAGALPFLLPACADADADARAGAGGAAPVSAAGLRAWARAQGGAGARKGEARTKAQDEELDDEGDRARCAAYLALVERRIRPAWVSTPTTAGSTKVCGLTGGRQLADLYLTDDFARVVEPRYIHPQTSSSAVRQALAYQLRAAARAEVHRVGGSTAPASIVAGARGAFEALEALLGKDEWFFGQREPGLLDAAVFAFTHLILELHVGRLEAILRDCEGLVRHQQRIQARFFRPGENTPSEKNADIES